MRDDDPACVHRAFAEYISRVRRASTVEASTSEDARRRNAARWVSDSAPRRGHVATRIDDACALLADVSARRREDVVDAYDFTYAYAREPGARHSERGAMVACWLRIFGGAEGGDARARATVLAFIEYIEGRTDVRYVTADVWSQARHFVRCVLEYGGGLTWYDEREAWPTLFDEFVEFTKEKMASFEASSGCMDDTRDLWTPRAETPSAVSTAFDGMMIARARSGDSRKRRGVEPTAMDEDDDHVNVNGLSQEFERELAVGRPPKRACSQVDVRDAGR
jgi:hypothetical protein